MPKLKPTEVNDIMVNDDLLNNPITDETSGETIEMGDNLYPLSVNPQNPTRFVYERPTKYDYTVQLPNGKTRIMTQDEKQAYRRKQRKIAERIASGKPINPMENRVKKSDEQKAQDRRDRRNRRNDTRYLAYEKLTRLPEYQGMTAQQVYESLKTEV